MDEAQDSVKGADILLRPNRRRVVLFFLACLGFVTIGITQTAWHGPSAIVWLCILFFGMCGAVLLAQLFPGASYLHIRGNGFEYCSLFRKSPLILWQDVSDFRVVRIPPSGKRMVVFDREAAPDYGIRRFNRSVIGATDGLPESYGLRPEELAELLNDWRMRSTRGR
jgi:hypothetical protein